MAGGEGIVDHRVKVHKPAFEERLRHPFQRSIHPPIQLNLVIQGAQDVSDRFLLGEGWNVYRDGV